MEILAIMGNREQKVQNTLQIQIFGIRARRNIFCEGAL